ncbi:hypothetical protein NDU88_000525 [Pleurodeles waltl]|uniref:Uncharacterized protein n=1 Tax=Pleurodeles waltl TaxID=8319 RepID=A0AAV7KMB8_PLEWA|nr:hypothetical protein NDU88_000525 [Pleurodeles waltl]
MKTSHVASTPVQMKAARARCPASARCLILDVQLGPQGIHLRHLCTTELDGSAGVFCSTNLWGSSMKDRRNL